MASEQPSPFILDSVKASASRFKETKNALDARQKELEALKAELDSQRADLERQAERVRAEREAFQQERDQVNTARGTMDRDLANLRMEREKAGREEELIKIQNERLHALEMLKGEMAKISEEMYSRQKEASSQHDSFVELQETLKAELNQLATEREKLAHKERSLVEAEKYLAAALEASGIEMTEPTEPAAKAPTPSTVEPRPPKPGTMPPPPPPAPGPPAPSIRSGESLRDEIFEEESSAGARPRVSRADALERMTKALETAKKARDTGRNVSEIRKTLKQARAAFEGGDYDTASRLAEEILRDLEAVPLTR